MNTSREGRAGCKGWRDTWSGGGVVGGVGGRCLFARGTICSQRMTAVAFSARCATMAEVTGIITKVSSAFSFWAYVGTAMLMIRLQSPKTLTRYGNDLDDVAILPTQIIPLVLWRPNDLSCSGRADIPKLNAGGGDVLVLSLVGGQRR